MDIRVEKGSPERYACELLLLFAFEPPEPLEGSLHRVDLEWKGFISTLIKQGDFKGELSECRLLHTQGALPVPRVLLTGLGKKEEFDLEKFRWLSTRSHTYLRRTPHLVVARPVRKR